MMERKKMSVIKGLRWAVKGIDCALFFLACGIVTFFLPLYLEPFWYYLLAAFTPFLWIPFEALLLKFWGRTVGRVVFGVPALPKITYGEALRRAARFSERSDYEGVQPSWRRQAIGAMLLITAVISSFYGRQITEFSIGFERGLSADGWVQYTSPNGEFTVSLPTDPTVEAKSLEIPTTDKTLAYEELTSQPTKKVSYVVTYMKLPSHWRLAGTSALLKGSLDVILKTTPDAELIDKQFTSHGPFRALDFQLKQDGQKIKGRLIIVKTTLYKLTTTYSPSAEQELQHQAFLDSLTLTE